MDKARYQTGQKMLSQLHGGHVGEAMVQELGDICPEFVDMTICDELFGCVELTFHSIENVENVVPYY